jgi:PKHD-type hydroxylase
MQLNHYFWCFKKVVPERICEDIKRYGLTKKKQTAITAAQQGTVPTIPDEIKKLHTQRDSDIVWLNERWIFREVLPYVQTANRNAGWNFQWDYSESAQFTIYTKKQHYDWHVDTGPATYDNPNNPNVHGKIRKLSTILSLSDPEDYEGGDLEFSLGNHSPKEKKQNTLIPKETAAKGTIVIFPSHIWHRVQPVTKGVRYSMPAWHLGYPFK